MGEQRMPERKIQGTSHKVQAMEAILLLVQA
jgi:hypothetical protein